MEMRRSRCNHLASISYTLSPWSDASSATMTLHGSFVMPLIASDCSVLRSVLDVDERCCGRGSGWSLMTSEVASKRAEVDKVCAG